MRSHVAPEAAGGGERQQEQADDQRRRARRRTRRRPARLGEAGGGGRGGTAASPGAAAPRDRGCRRRRSGRAGGYDVAQERRRVDGRRRERGRRSSAPAEADVLPRTSVEPPPPGGMAAGSGSGTDTSTPAVMRLPKAPVQPSSPPSSRRPSPVAGEQPGRAGRRAAEGKQRVAIDVQPSSSRVAGWPFTVTPSTVTPPAQVDGGRRRRSPSPCSRSSRSDAPPRSRPSIVLVLVAVTRPSSRPARCSRCGASAPRTPRDADPADVGDGDRPVGVDVGRHA